MVTCLTLLLISSICVLIAVFALYKSFTGIWKLRAVRKELEDCEERIEILKEENKRIAELYEKECLVPKK